MLILCDSLKIVKSYIFKFIPFFIICLFFGINDVNAQVYDLTLPRWDKNVFAISGQTWGYTQITQGSYAGYNGVYKSPTVNLPNAGNLAYQMVTSNMFYSSDVYKIEFYLTGMVMKYVQSVSVNDYICEIKKSSDLTLLVTCNAVKFDVYTYDGRDWNTMIIRAYYDIPDNVSSNSNFGIVSSINISSADVEQDIYDKMTSTDVDTSTLNNTSVNNDNGVLSAILTLPVDFFQSLLNGLTNYNSCPNLDFTLPYIDFDVSIPCIRTLMNKMGAQVFWESAGLLAGGLLMFQYLIHLGKELSDMMTLKETRAEWGGL